MPNSRESSPPAGRLALLGHELGHLVNGDPSTGLVTQPALATFGRLADIFDPRGLVDSSNVVAELLATVLAYTVFFPLHAACEWANAGLIRVAMQDHQRAEAYADALSVRLGGSRGAEELVRVLLFDKSITIALRRTVAGSDDPAEWPAATARTLESCGTQLKFSEQSSMRYGVSLYLEHPPSGLRSRLVRSWPPAAPAVSVPAGALAAADRELGRQCKSAARAISRWSI